jgi:hypothetical protein
LPKALALRQRGTSSAPRQVEHPPIAAAEFSLLKTRMAGMPHYFFQADYHGVTVVDDIGEEFSTLQVAEAHAAIVANELGRNDSGAVVRILDDQGILIAGPRNE